MKPLIRLPGLAWLALLAAGAAPAREPPPPLEAPRPFTLAQTSQLALPNGLRATLVPLGRVPKVTVTAVLRTGAIDEGEVTGIAAFTGELLKEGAGHYDAAALANRAADLGGALSVEAGADETLISLDVLSERVADAVDLLADVLRRPQLPASEVDRIRANISRQIAVERAESQAIAEEASARLLFGDHPYGRGFPTDRDLARYSADAARAFVSQQFGARRTHVYVVGKFDASQASGAIERNFADWASGAAPTLNVPAPRPGRTVQLIDRPGAPQSTILIGQVTIDPSADDFLALSLANTLLGGDFIARLGQDLREDKGWTYGVQSRITAQNRVSAWQVDTDVTTANSAAAIAEIFAQLERLRREAPSADELRLHQNYRGGAFVINASSRFGLTSQLAFLELHGLPESWLVNYPENINALTPAQVRDAAQKRLVPAQMSTVVVGDLAKIGASVRAVKALSGAQVLEERPQPGAR
jgi:predicted Zn-dependent peptidase